MPSLGFRPPPRADSWAYVTRGNFGVLVFYSRGSSELLQFCMVDNQGNVTVEKPSVAFESSTIGAVVAGAFS